MPPVPARCPCCGRCRASSSPALYRARVLALASSTSARDAPAPRRSGHAVPSWCSPPPSLPTAAARLAPPLKRARTACAATCGRSLVSSCARPQLCCARHAARPLSALAGAPPAPLRFPRGLDADGRRYRRAHAADLKAGAPPPPPQTLLRRAARSFRSRVGRGAAEGRARGAPAAAAAAPVAGRRLFVVVFMC